MKASISIHVETNELIITIKNLDWKAVEQASFYNGEIPVRELGNLTWQGTDNRIDAESVMDAERPEFEGKTYYGRVTDFSARG